MSIDLTLVIPCYNDGHLLEDSLRQIELIMQQTRYTYEILLIDDASPDGSAEAVRAVAASHPAVQAIVHAENVGRGGTVVEGMLKGRGAYVGFLDVDLEVHCRYIPAMLAALETGNWEGATALRVYKMQWRPSFMFRALLSVAYRKMVKVLLALPYEDTETGYKFFRRGAIEPVLKQCRSKGWFWDTEVMALAHDRGLAICEIPCLFVRRWDKQSTVKPVRDSIDYLREIFRFRARREKGET